jgi:hypothetical protein
MYALELKTDTGRVRNLQLWTLEEIKKHGGSSHLIRGRTEAEAFVEFLKKGETSE